MKRNGIEGYFSTTALAELYARKGIGYVWLPAWDMSTAGRTLVLPTAAQVLASMRRKGAVYIHCNARVGRSVAAVCGLLHYADGLSLAETEHAVMSGRPMAYFDPTALTAARPNFDLLFK